MFGRRLTITRPTIGQVRRETARAVATIGFMLCAYMLLDGGLTWASPLLAAGVYLLFVTYRLVRHVPGRHLTRSAYSDNKKPTRRMALRFVRSSYLRYRSLRGAGIVVAALSVLLVVSSYFVYGVPADELWIAVVLAVLAYPVVLGCLLADYTRAVYAEWKFDWEQSDWTPDKEVVPQD